MPELPEVETIRSGLEPLLTQETIHKVHVYDSRLRWPVSESLAMEIQGQKILSVTRRAKYLLIEITHGTLIIHLGMSGRLNVVPKETPLRKHDHVDIQFSNALTLRYHDPRRFGCVLFTHDPIQTHRLMHQLGPEPLSDAFHGTYLYECIHTKKCLIKSAIMNAKIVVGVGNIYAAEALFLAQINPYRICSSLHLDECEALAFAIKKILTQAIDEGGTTLKDFMDADGKPGYFAQSLRVYGRSNDACYVCKQNLISAVIHQRATVYCPSCQN